jgi:phage shock protein E
MSTLTVREIIKRGARIVDVRTPDEFMDGAFPNAVNIPVNEIQTRLTEFGPKNDTIVVYCASGGRSALAARMLMAAGYTDVVNAGGLYDMPDMD